MAFPLIAAALLGGAALGGLKAKRQQDQADAQNRYRKQAITYSPWTGMSDPGGGSAPSMAEGLLGGAAGGASLGASLQGMGVGADAPSGANTFNPNDFQQQGAMPNDSLDAYKWMLMQQRNQVG
jgi:hypothetical protein